MPRWYGQRGRMHAIIGDASLMAAHAGHPPSRGRLRRGSCYESQKPRLVQKGWDMLLQHAMRFRRCQWVSCCRRAARDSPTPSIRPGTLLRASSRRLSFEFFGFRPPHGFVSRNLIYLWGPRFAFGRTLKGRTKGSTVKVQLKYGFYGTAPSGFRGDEIYSTASHGMFLDGLWWCKSRSSSSLS